MRPNGHQELTGEEGGLDGQVQVDATDGNPLGIDDLTSPPQPRPWRWLGLFCFVLIGMAMLATVLVVTAAKEKRTSLLKAEAERLQQSVLGRVKVLETWLDAHHSSHRRLTDSHVFRLFATDLTLLESVTPLPRSLQDQRPYFRQLMLDFVRQSDMIGTTVLRDDGTILLSSPGPALPVTDLLRQIAEASSDWEMQLSPIRRIDDEDGTLVVDMMMPLSPIQPRNELTTEPAAFLVSTLPVAGILEEVLSSGILNRDRERIALLQQNGSGADRLSMAKDSVTITTDQLFEGFVPGKAIVFGRHGNDMPFYASGEALDDIPWTIYHALDAKVILSPVYDFILFAAIVSALTVLALLSAFCAFCWRQARNHHSGLASVFKDQALKAEQRRQFLHAVTTSIGDWLTVGSPDGQLIYTNPAFDVAIGRSGLSIAGKTWDDLVTSVTPVETSDGDIAELIDAHPFDLVEVGGDRRVISSHVAGLLAEDGMIQGMVRVTRDHTEVTVERRKRVRAIAQTVNAFVHAIELRDPFLLGHTHRLRCHAIAVGKRLGLSNDDLAGLALAASLSQIGKIFIPDEILAKPGRHSEGDEDVMRGHILHAVDVLERIDFDLPVVDILAQMHERLDGSGYPHGLDDEQIGLCARILGVADVFCARTAPRSYRERLSTGKTLYHLASNGQRYDLKVVAALAEIVVDDDEIDAIGVDERNFIDSAIWSDKQMKDDRLHQFA